MYVVDVVSIHILYTFILNTEIHINEYMFIIVDYT